MSLLALLKDLWRALHPERKTMSDGYCMGNWHDIHNWVHPRCREIGLPHQPHYIEVTDDRRRSRRPAP